VIGTVDEKGRALLDVSIGDKLDGAYTSVTTWIDTAFDGHLVVLSIGSEIESDFKSSPTRAGFRCWAPAC